MGRRVIALHLGFMVLLVIAFFLDAQVAAWLSGHTTPAVFEAARLVSRYGAWHWLMLPLLVMAVWAWSTRRRSLLRLVVIAATISSIAGLSADLLRASLGRARPNASAPAGWYGPTHFGNSHYASFPSGHVAAVTGLTAAFLLARRRIGLALLLLVGLIAAARLTVRAHYFSDVIASIWLSIAITRAWFRRFEWRTPSATADPNWSSKT
jgi:membrane-associated phospholipid phosphatase